MLEIVHKTISDRFLTETQMPAHSLLISITVLSVVAFVRSSKTVIYRVKILIIALLLTYDTFIKIYINLVSPSNLQEITMHNMYTVIASLISIRVLRQNYNKKQYIGMLFISTLAILQILYGNPSDEFDFHWKDLADLAGTICNMISVVIYTKYLKKHISNEWDYQFSLTWAMMMFSVILYIIDMIFIEHKNFCEFSPIMAPFVVVLLFVSQHYFICLKTELCFFNFFLINQFVNFTSNVLSDYINGSKFTLFQFVLGLSSSIITTLVYYDEKELEI